MTKKTLLIGGAGFIGGHLAPVLYASGRDVTVLGRRPNKSSKWNTKDIAYVQGDFNDMALLERLIPTGGEVVQLAYATVPNTSFDDPLADLNQNLPPTLHLIKLCADKGAKLILISSGGVVYGDSQFLPISEVHPTHPISPYGITKLAIENYAHLFSVTHGLQYLCLRPGNPYGSGQLPFMGQGFIATALALLLQGKSVTVFGTSGTVRDYIAVSDLAAGILAAMNTGLVGETYNIGSGIGFSNLAVLELLAECLKPLGCRLSIDHHPARPFDVRINVLDCSKLHSASGWIPKIALADGLTELVDFTLAQQRF